ncbi:unnamed protein product [Schistosoma mattheei]|uniref:TPX2 domain-containing protein n=2 Tax=Schistosoma mattheei TaxID=31246 RepID=A0AA85C1M8_9TREM|nr:unnamed protein product [Schistosoma mattheei]
MNDLNNVEYLSRILDNWSASSGHLRPPKSDRSNTLQEIYYPVTLGNMTEYFCIVFIYLNEDTMNVVNMLISKRFYTFSPPAFGSIKRPGDDFYPWQCVLAEEAPVLATTVYRQAVDKADFECVIDESGELYQPRTTTSVRRYHPKDNPPTSLGYLKTSVKQLLGNLNPSSKSSLNYHSLFISPVHQNLLEARLKRLKLEEKMLMQAEKLDMLERIRKPLPRWYTIKTPQFFYEARKHNELLKSHQYSDYLY